MIYIQIPEKYDAAGFLTLAKGDTPIHCLADNIYGVRPDHIKILKRKRIPFKKRRVSHAGDHADGAQGGVQHAIFPAGIEAQHKQQVKPNDEILEVQTVRGLERVEVQDHGRKTDGQQCRDGFALTEPAAQQRSRAQKSNKVQGQPHIFYREERKAYRW